MSTEPVVTVTRNHSPSISSANVASIEVSGSKTAF